jgi:hypothetical protein
MAMSSKNLGSGEVDDQMMKEIDTDLQKLKSEFYKFRDLTGNNFKNLEDMVNKKADRDELLDLEARIMEKLNEMLRKLMGNFADRSDTLKRLASLEKNVSFTHIITLIPFLI